MAGRIEVIVTWLEAFSIYSLILCSYFPHRWCDLSRYELLILRTYHQFSGKVWQGYDRAFRENAAATCLTDWSTMNSQLFNFYSARAAACSPYVTSTSSNAEPRSSPTSQSVCRSWNNGQCTAPLPYAALHINVLVVRGALCK